MKRYESVEEYADHIRVQSVTLWHTLNGALGGEHRATAIALELLNEAVAIVNGTEMERERESIEALDLATLPVPGSVPGPFDEE